MPPGLADRQAPATCTSRGQPPGRQRPRDAVRRQLPLDGSGPWQRAGGPDIGLPREPSKQGADADQTTHRLSIGKLARTPPSSPVRPVVRPSPPPQGASGAAPRPFGHVAMLSQRCSCSGETATPGPRTPTTQTTPPDCMGAPTRHAVAGLVSASALPLAHNRPLVPLALRMGSVVRGSAPRRYYAHVVGRLRRPLPPAEAWPPSRPARPEPTTCSEVRAARAIAWLLAARRSWASNRSRQSRGRPVALLGPSPRRRLP
jgi:hypothetical protein